MPPSVPHLLTFARYYVASNDRIPKQHRAFLREATKSLLVADHGRFINGITITIKC